MFEKPGPISLAKECAPPWETLSPGCCSLREPIIQLLIESCAGPALALPTILVSRPAILVYTMCC